MKKGVKEAVKYGIVGVTGIAVEWLTFFLFRDLLGIDFWVAQPLSLICGTINNFILNSYFTFKATDHIAKRAVSFFGIASIGWIINYFIIQASVYLLSNHLNDLLQIQDPKMIQNIAKLTATIIVAGIQFFANKYLTFRKK